MKTYLQLINEVLKRLREDQVGTVDYSSYSTLIGTFVNDAKREVEDAWNWLNLTTTIIFDLDAGGSNQVSLSEGSTSIISVTGQYATERSRLLYDTCNRPMAFMTTDGKEQQLIQMPDMDLQAYRILNDDALEMTDPIHFSLRMIDGDIGIHFRDDPLEDRTYRIRMCNPQEDLEDATDELIVPWRPVVHLATLYALDERGEEIGEPGSKAWMRFEKSLGDAIALDSITVPERITFSV